MANKEAALRLCEDDQVSADQVAYVDGYTLEERLLEGVLFKVERVVLGTGYHLVCNGVHPDSEAYMTKFSRQQKEGWYREAVRYLTHNGGEAQTLDKVDVYWDFGDQVQGWQQDGVAPAEQTPQPTLPNRPMVPKRVVVFDGIGLPPSIVRKLGGPIISTGDQDDGNHD